MAKKKVAPKKKPAAKKKPATKKKAAAKKKLVAKKPVAAKKIAKPVKAILTKKTPAPKKKPAPIKKTSSRVSQETAGPIAIRGRRGLGSDSGGQSGDIQGLSREEEAESESVEELTEEGQDFEAEVVSGVEHALDPDEGEVTTSEVPEDDVPEEYTDSDK